LDHFLGRPLKDLLQGEPSAPFVVKCINREQESSREMVLRIKQLKDNSFEIITAYELPRNF